MKPLPIVGVLVIVAACLLAPAGAMGAHPCPAGCGSQKKACLQIARVGKLVCKLDCRASAGPATLGACLRGCTEQFGTAKTACAGDHAACLGFCPPAPLPGSCTGAFLDGCGQNLAACARGVVAQAKRACRGVRRHRIASRVSRGALRRRSKARRHVRRTSRRVSRRARVRPDATTATPARPTAASTGCASTRVCASTRRGRGAAAPDRPPCVLDRAAWMPTGSVAACVRHRTRSAPRAAPPAPVRRSPRPAAIPSRRATGAVQRGVRARA